VDRTGSLNRQHDDQGVPGVTEVVEDESKHDADIEARQREWLAAPIGQR
jgi:hypothetical protein